MTAGLNMQDADDLRDSVVPQALAKHTLADHPGRAEQSHSHTQEPLDGVVHQVS